MTEIFHGLRIQLTDAQQPGFWIMISLGACLLASWIAWAARQRLPCWPSAARLLGWSGVSVISWFGISLVQLIVPLLALKAGAISPSFLGISELDWRLALTSGITLGIVTVSVMIVGIRTYRHDQPIRAGEDRGLWPRLANAALLQWQAAFYRAASIGWLISSASDRAVYWGSWLAILLLAAVRLLDPLFHRRWRHLEQSEQIVIDALVIVATTALFTFTRNLYLCLAVHLVVTAANAGRSRLSRASTLS